jgi:hypothetical protein
VDYEVSATGIANCIHAKSGEEIYRERLPGKVRAGKGGLIYAFPVRADGNL